MTTRYSDNDGQKSWHPSFDTQVNTMHYYDLLSDDHGWKICEQYMGLAEERHPGNTKEKQLRPQLRGALPQCLHNGTTQTRREVVYWPKGSRHWASYKQGQRGSVQIHSDLALWSPQYYSHPRIKVALGWSQFINVTVKGLKFVHLPVHFYLKVTLIAIVTLAARVIFKIVVGFCCMFDQKHVRWLQKIALWNITYQVWYQVHACKSSEISLVTVNNCYIVTVMFRSRNIVWILNIFIQYM